MRERLARLVNAATERIGYEVRRTPRRRDDPHGQVVHLTPPDGEAKGRALLAYRVEPFLRPSNISHAHTNYWESHEMARVLLARGLAVDAVSYRNTDFVPTVAYDVFIGARTNFQRLAGHLGPGCVKVAHLDTSHWLTNNQAAYTRLLNLQRRRGVSLHNRKMIEPNWALEHADIGTVLGNEFTLESYRYAGRPLQRIPISAPFTYDWLERDFARCRHRFLWFGSDGFVHKGLDLVLEAFAAMPELHLTVCGPFDQERDFVEAYRRELFETPNITAHGWIDVAGEDFLELARNTIGLVYPTCAEGGGGSVISCMHAGMIPLVPPSASVDLGDGGILLESCGIADIQNAVRGLAELPAERLEELSRSAWEQARTHHTKTCFTEAFEAFVDGQLAGARALAY